MPVILSTLKYIDENDLPLSRVNDVLNYFVNVLPKYETKYLVEFLKFCLKGFQNMNSSKLRYEHKEYIHIFVINRNCFSWKDIFPEIVSKLSEKESIEFEGKCLNGKELEKEVVDILCSLQWEPSRVVIVISIFW